MNLILATAGLSPIEMEEAATRLLNQASKLYKFDKVIMLTQKNIQDYCPEVYRKYQNQVNESTKGYGFYAWKAELVHQIMSGKFGNCDGVVWIDAGCECFSNPATRYIFKRMISNAKKQGGWFYKLRTPEFMYTKADLLQQYKKAAKVFPQYQIQANFFILFGNRGKKLAEFWKNLALQDIKNIDFSLSKIGEIGNFVEHRNDQSLLSISVKELGFSISNFVPISNPSSKLFKVRSYFNPVWVVRNRTGKSIIEK